MNCNYRQSNNNHNCECIANILKKICCLQENASCDDAACSRDYLGPASFHAYNTRPVTLYTANNTPWAMPFGDGSETSIYFRIERLNGCCATFRVLEPNRENPGQFLPTTSFFTVDLKCFCGITCSPDVCVAI